MTSGRTSARPAKSRAARWPGRASLNLHETPERHCMQDVEISCWRLARETFLVVDEGVSLATGPLMEGRTPENIRASLSSASPQCDLAEHGTPSHRRGCPCSESECRAVLHLQRRRTATCGSVDCRPTRVPRGPRHRWHCRSRLGHPALNRSAPR